MVLGITLLFTILHLVYVGGGPTGGGGMQDTDVPLLMVGFGFGASFVALFAQLGAPGQEPAASGGGGMRC